METKIWKTALFGGLMLLLSGIWLYLFMYYEKFDAEWFGGVKVIYISTLAAFLVALALANFRWFQNRFRSAPVKMFAIVAVGLILSTMLGIYFTEPAGRTSMSDEEYSYNDYSRSRAGIYYYYLFVDTADVAAGTSIPDIDLEGEGVVILFLIVLVVFLVVASIFISHFWVLSGVVLITIMGMFVYREITSEPEPEYRGR